jgi:hypothetical protein
MSVPILSPGPHVKLMKPKQLLRQLEPPGPEPTFTRRQQWTLTLTERQVGAAGRVCGSVLQRAAR